MKYYAHSLEGQPPDEWQTFEEHLENVAAMTSGFARAFWRRRVDLPGLVESRI
ncbi:MAG: hypothetical protein HY885_13835 [Deltaproteobacteria bacterium]|nr:hypothetical protein [Deltaproteobacteria bacterium]